MAMIVDPDDFFSKGCGRCARFATPDCSIRRWIRGLNDLRKLCLDMGLEETVKWAHPCYRHAGRNIAIITAFRDDFRVTFMNPSLLVDGEGVLELQGPNSQTPSMLRFTADDQVGEKQGVIQAYLHQLKVHAEAGTKPKRIARELEMPDELAEALDADSDLADAFHALTPGRQRSYLFALGQAKQSATRVGRIGKYRGQILAGKGALER